MRPRQAVAEVQLAEDQGKADGGKPEVAADAVQDAAHAGILLGHARQLAVGAVKGVGPSDQQHAHPVEPRQMRLVEVEHDTAGNAHEDAGDGDCVGANTQLGKKLCPQETQWAVKVQVKPLLGVHRLE